MENHFQELADKWPSSFVARDQIHKFTGGIIKKGRMANLDSLGLGPERIRIGRKVAYPVKTLIEWLILRSEPIERRVKP